MRTRNRQVILHTIQSNNLTRHTDCRHVIRLTPPNIQNLKKKKIKQNKISFLNKTKKTKKTITFGGPIDTSSSDSSPVLLPTTTCASSLVKTELEANKDPSPAKGSGKQRSTLFCTSSQVIIPLPEKNTSLSVRK
jgi:hypothetical protein